LGQVEVAYVGGAGSMASRCGLPPWPYHGGQGVGPRVLGLAPWIAQM